MKQYNSYQYIYPPRPEAKITPALVSKYDNGEYAGQPKYNGSCAVIFLNDEGFCKIMNRHNESFSKGKIKIEELDLKSLFRGTGFMVLTGELLNKSKIGEDGKVFNQKLIIWDILVFNSEYLVGKTFDERMNLLNNLYPTKNKLGNHILDIGIKGVYKAPLYYSAFDNVYNDLIKTDVYEGFVLKRRAAKLEFGLHSANNTKWMIKVRKPTKNYKR